MAKTIVFKCVYLVLTILVLTSKESKAKMIRDCKLNADDYKSVLQSDCYVDKSLLVKTFLAEQMRRRVLYVTAPSRFGKTINMDMLKTFLEIEDGQITQSLTKGCSLFKKHNLNIYKYKNKEFFNTHCGSYPVIYFSLKFIKGSFVDILEAFKYQLRKLFLQHKYLLKSDNLLGMDKMLFSCYIEKNSSEELPEMAVRVSLYHLSEWLCTHFLKRVILLIDDYDVPYWRLLNNEFPIHEALRTINFINNFTHFSIRGNKYIDRVLINTCLRVTLNTANVNNITIFPFTGENPLVKYYGLTAEEIREKLNSLNITRRIEDIEHHYGGYKTQSSGITVYNTWSVMNYLQTETLVNRLVDTHWFADIQQLFHKGTVRELIITALERGTIKINMIQASIVDMMMLKDVIVNGITLNPDHAELFINFLLDNGYFTPIAKDSNTSKLMTPNEEVRQYFFKTTNSDAYFEKHYQIDPTKSSDFLTALNCLGSDKNNTESLTRFREAASALFHQNEMPDSEIALQGYIYNVIKNSEMFNFTTMEVSGILKKGEHLSTKEGTNETNDREEAVTTKRVDIMTTREKDGAGIVIETRRNRESAEEALAQIVNVVLPNYEMFASDDYSRLEGGNIYIGLHLNTDTREVTTCYLVNESNLHSKICV